IVARGRAFRAMLAKIALNNNRLDSGLVHSGSISIIGVEITHHHPCLVFVVTRRFPLDDIERLYIPFPSCPVQLRLAGRRCWNERVSAYRSRWVRYNEQK